MAMTVQRPLSLTALLTLGRVSNLPTVWTNVLAGAVLAGGAWHDGRTGIVLVAMSLFYVGGMYLNDYFDRGIDARERPGRPIPAGDVAAPLVATIGFGLLAAGVALLATTGLAAAICGLGLAALIAGVSLVDAALIASAGASAPALLALAGFVATVLLQRYISGT